MINTLSKIGSSKIFICFLKYSVIALTAGAITACTTTTGSQILDKEKGWIQIDHRGQGVEVFFCDATQKWPTCKVPDYVRQD
jgi:hypothetical protein